MHLDYPKPRVMNAKESGLDPTGTTDGIIVTYLVQTQWVVNRK